MSQRMQTILSTLQSGPTSAQTLASLLDAPQASIRRDVIKLRNEGYRIDDARDNNGLYRLTVAAQ